MLARTRPPAEKADARTAGIAGLGVLRRAERLVLTLAALAVLVAAGLLAAGPQSWHVDLGWHLAQARWMIENGSVYARDAFNYPTLHQPFVNEYPAFHLLLAIAWTGGEIGLAALAAVFAVLIWGLPLAEAWRRRRLSWFLIAAVFLGVALGLRRLVLRPELVTSLGLVIFAILLLRDYASPSLRRLWPLAAFMVLWTNSHSGFVLGPLLTLAIACESSAAAALAGRRQGDGGLQGAAAAFCRRARAWLPVVGAVSMAALVNPFGWERLAAPFFHQSSPAIKTYVSEMQPGSLSLDGPGALVLLQAVLIAAAAAWYRRLSPALLLLWLGLVWASLDHQRHGALAAVAAPLVILASLALGAPPHPAPAWRITVRALRLSGGAVLLSLALVPASLAFSSRHPAGLPKRWHDFVAERVEFPPTCARWIARHFPGHRLLHRTEIGGALQLAGLAAGSTFADTGFGKYRETQIAALGRICERPALLPAVVEAYQPAAVVTGSHGFSWLPELSRLGWRCVYYQPGATVWVAPDSFPDLPTVALADVQARSNAGPPDLPGDPRITFRRILELKEMGLPEPAAAALFQLPPDLQASPLWWETVEKFLFEGLPVPESLAKLFIARAEAERAPGALSLRARQAATREDWSAVEAILRGQPPDELTESAALSLAESCLRAGRLADARRLLEADRLFDRANPHRFRLLAELAEREDNPAAARGPAAWAGALAPDDPRIRALCERLQIPLPGASL